MPEGGTKSRIRCLRNIDLPSLFFYVLFMGAATLKDYGDGMVRLQEHNGQHFVCIPKIIVKKKKWQKGQELFCQFNEGGNIVLEEV